MRSNNPSASIEIRCLRSYLWFDVIAFRTRWSETVRLRRATWIIASALLISLNGCHRTKPNATPPTPPVAEVEVVSPLQQKMLDHREFTGRTAAADKVEVRSRVSGYILQTPRSKSQADNTTPTAGAVQRSNDTPNDFPRPGDNLLVSTGEGDIVKKDDVLFVIDPEPYQISFDQALASQAAGQATLKRFDLELARAKELIATKSVAQAEFDLAVANQAESAAQQKNLEAAVQRAKLDLRYTRVLTPIGGIVGQALVTRGNLVIADTTVLTTVVATDPIYVYFDVDEQSLLDYRQRIRSGSVKSARDTQIDIQMALANETDFTHAGHIDFVDNVTDPATGNTRIRGTFPNADNSLSPGLFARVKVPFTAEYDALLVPTRALAVDQQGRFLMVVDDKQVAQRRAVEIGTEIDGKTVITKGLKPEDIVIVVGLQKIRPKVPVKTKPLQTTNESEKNASENQLNPAKDHGS